MILRRLVPLGVPLVILAAWILLAAPWARAGHSVSITIDDSAAMNSCDDLKITFGDRGRLDTARAQTVLVASRTELPVLRASLPQTGGISVRAWDRDTYEVTVCKAAGTRGEAAAEALVDRVSGSIRDGKVVVDGPEGGNWIAYLLIRAPEKSAIDLLAENGGISLYDLSGNIRLRTRNGPIALHGCSGDIEVDAENGPIDLSGGGGRVALRAENGPISVSLADRWEGEGLTVRTENGPLGVQVPDRVSGIQIQSAGHSPVSCKAEACAGARKTWDDDRRSIEFGRSPFVVRMSTVNGPISVSSREFE